MILAYIKNLKQTSDPTLSFKPGYLIPNASQNGTFFDFLWFDFGAEDSSDGFIKNSLQSLLCQCRAFQVLSCTNILSHCQTLRVGNGGQFLFLQLLNGFLVFSQIQLGAHQNDGSVGAVVTHFRVPLGFDIFKTCRADQGKAYKEHISLWIGKWS